MRRGEELGWAFGWAGAPFWIMVAALALARGEAAEPPVRAVTDHLIGIDLSVLDANGLVGPPGGKSALSYEFCIPAGDSYAIDVRGINPSVIFSRASPGRIGCTASQVLVVGNTHQPGFASILQRLAELPYVERIIESHFE